MKRFIVFPGLINEQYQHDSLEDARASAKAIAVTSEDAFVCEVHYAFERSTDVTEAMQPAANTPQAVIPSSLVVSAPVAQADGTTTQAVEAPVGNVDPRQGYVNP